MFLILFVKRGTQCARNALIQINSPLNDTLEIQEIILEFREKVDIYYLKLELERPMFIRIEFRVGIQPLHILVKTERCNSLELGEFALKMIRGRSLLSFAKNSIFAG